MIQNNEIINDDLEVAETLNVFFTDVVKQMELVNEFSTPLINGDSTSISAILTGYSDHPSILKIKETLKISPSSFKLRNISVVEIGMPQMISTYQRVGGGGGGGLGDIPAKLLKMCRSISSAPICDAYNNSLSDKIFPEKLKNADITPVHQRHETTNKEKYRPVNILPIVSKLYEKHIYSQIYIYINQYLSDKLYGFRKGFNSQYTLISLLEKLKRSLDSQGIGAALLTDLSKAFDCLNHNLMIAKLHANDFDESSLKFNSSYPVGRNQRTRIGNSYSSWTDIVSGVPQGSILVPRPF